MRYAKLKGLIRERYGTQAKFAKAMNMKLCTLSWKLSGKTEWKASEIRRACEVLGIPAAEIPSYFFYPDC